MNTSLHVTMGTDASLNELNYWPLKIYNNEYKWKFCIIFSWRLSWNKRPFIDKERVMFYMALDMINILIIHWSWILRIIMIKLVSRVHNFKSSYREVLITLFDKNSIYTSTVSDLSSTGLGTNCLCYKQQISVFFYNFKSLVVVF